MASSTQDHDAFSSIKDAFTDMVRSLETNEITEVDRSTTAGGIKIADFKREVALKRFVNHNLPRGMTEFSTYAKGVFTQYGWNTRAISKLSRGVDYSETVLALIKKGDTDAADLVQQLSRLRSEKVYMKPQIDGLQERLRSAYKSHPEFAPTVWLPSVQSLAKARSVGKTFDTKVASTMSAASAKIFEGIVATAIALDKSVEEAMTFMDFTEDEKAMFAPYMKAEDADATEDIPSVNLEDPDSEDEDDEEDFETQVKDLFAMLRQ